VITLFRVTRDGQLARDLGPIASHAYSTRIQRSLFAARNVRERNAEAVGEIYLVQGPQ
jgi:hypothetical protein